MLLDITVIVSLLLALVCAAYGLLAFFRETEAEKKVKQAAEELSETAKKAAKATTGDGTLGGEVNPNAAFAGPAEYLKALAAFSDSLSKLKRDVAAMVLSLAFLLVATVGAGINDKFTDKEATADKTGQAKPTP